MNGLLLFVFTDYTYTVAYRLFVSLPICGRQCFGKRSKNNIREFNRNMKSYYNRSVSKEFYLLYETVTKIYGEIHWGLGNVFQIHNNER